MSGRWGVDRLLVAGLVPLAFVIVAWQSVSSGPMDDLIRTARATFAEPVTFEVRPRAEGPAARLLDVTEGGPFVRGTIVDGDASFTVVPFGDTLETRVIDGRELFTRTTMTTEVWREVGLRIPTQGEFREAVPADWAADQVDAVMTVVLGRWVRIETPPPADDLGATAVTVATASDGTVTYSLQPTELPSVLALAAGTTAAAGIRTPDDPGLRIEVDVRDGRVTTARLGATWEVTFEPAATAEPIARPDEALSVSQATYEGVEDRVGPALEALHARLDAGGAPGALALLRDVAAVQEQVRQRTGRYSEDIADLDAAGLERPALSYVRLCTTDDGTEYLAVTVLSQDGEPAGWVVGTGIEPQAFRRESLPAELPCTGGGRDS